MSDSKIFRDFYEAQVSAMHKLTSKQPGPTDKRLANPARRVSPESGEEGLAFICSKKPSPPKVMKFIQNEIDAIVAENE